MTMHDRVSELKRLLDELEAMPAGEDDAEAASSQLLDLLDRRQRLVERIVVLDRALTADELSAEAAAGMDACEEVLRRVLDRDEHLRRRLTKRKDAVASRIASIGRGRSALAAYANRTREPKTRFQDTQV